MNLEKRVKITLNGKNTEFNGVHIDDILKEYKLNPERIAVELNGEIVHREKYKSRSISEGDRIEIVTFVGGG
jgi:sulfur carrier protein